MSTDGQSALSRELLENKGVKKRFSLAQSRYRTENKGCYKKL
jgi:hypothetical protein